MKETEEGDSMDKEKLFLIYFSIYAPMIPFILLSVYDSILNKRYEVLISCVSVSLAVTSFIHMIGINYVPYEIGTLPGTIPFIFSIYLYIHIKKSKA